MIIHTNRHLLFVIIIEYTNDDKYHKNSWTPPWILVLISYFSYLLISLNLKSNTFSSGN